MSSITAEGNKNAQRTTSQIVNQPSMSAASRGEGTSGAKQKPVVGRSHAQGKVFAMT